MTVPRFQDDPEKTRVADPVVTDREARRLRRIEVQAKKAAKETAERLKHPDAGLTDSEYYAERDAAALRRAGEVKGFQESAAGMKFKDDFEEARFRTQLERDTGLPLTAEEFGLVRVRQVELLTQTPNTARDAVTQRNIMEMMSEMKDRVDRNRPDAHVEVEFDNLVTSVEAAMDAERKGNIPEVKAKLAQISAFHKERVLNREAQEGITIETPVG